QTRVQVGLLEPARRRQGAAARSPDADGREMELTMYATDKDAVVQRLDALSAQVALLIERQDKRTELYDELSPVLHEVMATASAKLDAIEKRGWFEFGGALAEVAERILDHYTAADVR